MVAFSVTRGGQYLIVAELPLETSHVERMIFRCYASQPQVTVTAHRMTRRPQKAICLCILSHTMST